MLISWGIFKIDIFENDEDGCRALDYISGTCWWHEAMREACTETGVEKFFKWYEELSWIESDEFDCDLVTELVEMFAE